MFRAALSLALAAGIWVPSLHFFFRAGDSDLKAMAGHQLTAWRDPALREKETSLMRKSNAEWDFMGRTFLALALCEMAERDGRLKGEYLPVTDAIIDDTLATEKARGMHFFLMPYSQASPYRVQPERSLFIDGEIALMLAARRLVEEKVAYKDLFATRRSMIEGRLRGNAAMAVESYPNECWLFDHAVALAALRLGDHLDGTDHGELFERWGDIARRRLTHAQSGMIVSSYTTTNEWIDGPEGSSIWAAVHFMRVFDPNLAREQYEVARRGLARTLFGFGWSREWPLSWRNFGDVDSGAVVPLVDAGAGASGLALVGSASFKDREFHEALRTSLNFAAFPVRKNGTLRYCASNAVGDAALLYSQCLGALWEKVNRGSRRQ